MRFQLVHGLIVALICSGSRAEATFIVNGSGADQSEFLSILNEASEGGTWILNGLNRLSFSRGSQASNYFADVVEELNNRGDRILDVKQNYPGVFVGAFGPSYSPAMPGVQLLDLGDLRRFPIALEPVF